MYSFYVYNQSLTTAAWSRLHVFFYGAGIWGLSEQKKINTVQNKACRYFLGLGKNAANIASQGDSEIGSCRLYVKIQCTDDNKLVKKVFRWSSTHGKS